MSISTGLQLLNKKKFGRNAFSFLEMALTIFLAGVIGAVSYYFFNLTTLNAINYKSTLQSQINLMGSMIFQCKSLSEQFPKELNSSSNATNNLLTELECNTSVPYAFDGGRNGFIPLPPGNFSPYRATEIGNEFYIFTTAENNSTESKALEKLIVNYTSTQATLEHNATSATFKFYLSR
jgi:hypothetical protein